MRASLILLAACHLSAQGVPPDGASGGDAPGSDTVSSDATDCFGTGLFHACPSLAGALTLNGALDTTADPRCQSVPQPMGSDVCVVAGTDVNINSVRAVGARPLAIIASGTITINDILDVSSSSGKPGAGANAASCTSADGSASNGGAGGGAGGSFGGAGGDAGDGLGATGGAAAAAITPPAVRGGCPGGSGGKGTGVIGPGGDGGGAVYLIARGQIQIASGAHITASGAGGAGG